MSLSRLLMPLLGTVTVMVSLMSFGISRHFLLIDDQYYFASSSPIQKALGSFRQDDTASDHPADHVSVVTYPVEDPIPNPEPADGNRTFSACLLVMDDNHRLAEWLAYHYHVLPLRYLVVAVDPRSKTSPTFLLNRWRKKGMYIVEWTDADFWRNELRPLNDSAPFQQKRDRHRGRQKFYYRRCLQHMKRANRTWVALHDSDEYLLYNHAGGKDYLNWLRHVSSRYKGKKILLPSQTPPTTAQPGALIDYIRQEQAAGIEYYQSPCIGIPRLMFGALPSSPQESTEHESVPHGIDASQLDTLTWRHHAGRNDFVKNALGKVLMDVSRIDMDHVKPFQSLHRPIKTICAAPWHNDWEVGLRINHYLGSWESYSFRDDSRRGGERSREQWEYKATTNGQETDDNIRPWLSGFVEEHGLEEAQALLQAAGLPKEYQNHNDTGWGLLPEKLDEILSVDETITNDNKKENFDKWVRNKYKKSNENSDVERR